jgi:hypothetical protein
MLDDACDDFEAIVRAQARRRSQTVSRQSFFGTLTLSAISM